ncbi:hypothetical protein SAMN05877809_10879 [Rhodobacter sp. JA431]|nr:hypothetical protein SAMN05877809_10879 [Rhodobacter sp. JA431]
MPHVVTMQHLGRGLAASSAKPSPELSFTRWATKVRVSTVPSQQVKIARPKPLRDPAEALARGGGGKAARQRPQFAPGQAGQGLRAKHRLDRHPTV